MTTKILAVLFSLCVLTACGGSGDSNSGPNTTPSLAGLYAGSFTDNPSGTTFDLAVIVAPNGRAYLLSLDGGRIYVGALEGSGNNLSGSLRTYDFVAGNSYAVAGTASSEIIGVSGAFVSGDGASGSFRSSERQTGTFSINYLTAETEAGASLEKLVGRWAGEDSSTSESTHIDIASDGSYSGADSQGCTLSGQITVLDPEINVYNFSYREDCPTFGVFEGSGLLNSEIIDGQETLVALLSGSGVAAAYILTKTP